LRNSYLKGAVTLRDFRVERNGNGRDFDILPSFEGEFAHGYRLTFAIVPAAGRTPITIHSSGYYLDKDSNISAFVRQHELRRLFPDFTLGRDYAVRATLTLDVGNGGQSGYWSEAFIERVFPVRMRSQSLMRQARF
jgi:hypothetical protein